jgi:hypothetical protein
MHSEHSALCDAASETPAYEIGIASGLLIAVERQHLRDEESLYINLESPILSDAQAQAQATNVQITPNTVGSATVRLLLTEVSSELVAMIFHDYFSRSSAHHYHLIDGNQGTENVKVIHVVAELPSLCVDHPLFWSTFPPALSLDLLRLNRGGFITKKTTHTGRYLSHHSTQISNLIT